MVCSKSLPWHHPCFLSFLSLPETFNKSVSYFQVYTFNIYTKQHLPFFSPACPSWATCILLYQYTSHILSHQAYDANYVIVFSITSISSSYYTSYISVQTSKILIWLPPPFSHVLFCLSLIPAMYSLCMGALARLLLSEFSGYHILRMRLLFSSVSPCRAGGVIL